MKVLFITIVLILPSLCFADEKYIGTYDEISEADCNTKITLQKSGKGFVTWSCSVEDGPDAGKSSDTNTNFTWTASDDKISMVLNGKTHMFTYIEKISCDRLGLKGSYFGLIASKIGPNYLFGEGDGTFYGVDAERKCK